MFSKGGFVLLFETQATEKQSASTETIILFSSRVWDRTEEDWKVEAEEEEKGRRKEKMPMSPPLY